MLPPSSHCTINTSTRSADFSKHIPNSSVSPFLPLGPLTPPSPLTCYYYCFLSGHPFSPKPLLINSPHSSELFCLYCEPAHFTFLLSTLSWLPIAWKEGSEGEREGEPNYTLSWPRPRIEAIGGIIFSLNSKGIYFHSPWECANGKGVCGLRGISVLLAILFWRCVSHVELNLRRGHREWIL